MRRDDTLLAAARPALRLYGWRPACASLGRSQSPATVDLDAARELRVDVVQRATGGGAILHNEEEVTYGIVVPLDFPGLPRDIPGSFAFLSEGVRLALVSLGLPVEVESAAGGRADDPLCYVRHQGTNLFVGGRKISGGAQRRTNAAILQHGTVIVRRDEERMARLFRTPVEEIRAKVTSLAGEGVDVERDELVARMVKGYEQALGVRLDHGARDALG